MGAKIQDEFTKLDISGQRKYQLRKLAKGLCKTCGAKRANNSTQYCAHHKQLRDIDSILRG